MSSCVSNVYGRKGLRDLWVWMQDSLAMVANKANKSWWTESTTNPCKCVWDTNTSVYSVFGIPHPFTRIADWFYDFCDLRYEGQSRNELLLTWNTAKTAVAWVWFYNFSTPTRQPVVLSITLLFCQTIPNISYCSCLLGNLVRGIQFLFRIKFGH